LQIHRAFARITKPSIVERFSRPMRYRWVR
jgi:hypothetical protein